MIDDELQDWIDRSLNDCTTDEELQALEDRLLKDEQARDHYLNAVNVHASLHRRFSVAEETTIPFSSGARRRFGVGLAIAAGLAVIIGRARCGGRLARPGETGFLEWGARHGRRAGSG